MTYPYDSHEPARFSRHWWAKGIRNLVWVALVTVLIWVYADLEKTETREFSAVKIRLTTGSADDLTLASPAEVEVKFSVRGSNSSLDRYANALAGKLVPVDVAQRGLQLGENTLQTAEDILDPLTGVTRSGLTIAAVEPRFIKVTLARPESEFRARLVLHTGSGKDLALLDKTDMTRREIDLTFRLRGSRSAMTSFQRELADSNSQIRFDLTKSLAAGKHDLNIIADILNPLESISGRGLKVMSAMPPAASVELDRVLFVPDVEVRFRATGATIGDAAIRPPQMGLYVAKSRWDEVLKSQPKPVLETVTVDLTSAATDKPLNVPIDPYIAGVPVKPEQPAVDVDVKISQLTGEKTLIVPVRLLTPQVWAEDGTWDRYILKRKDPSDWRKKITIRGAKKDVERLQVDDVDAYLVLNDNDKLPTTSWLTRDVEIRLPKDLQLQVVGDKPKVDFRFDTRTTTP